ncbi:hypothetical protein ACKWTF_014697 [Chironomus riparius]
MKIQFILLSCCLIYKSLAGSPSFHPNEAPSTPSSTVEQPPTSPSPSSTEEPPNSTPMTIEQPLSTQEPSSSGLPSSTQEPSSSGPASSTQEPSSSGLPSRTQEPSTSAAPTTTEKPSTSPEATTEKPVKEFCDECQSIWSSGKEPSSSDCDAKNFDKRTVVAVYENPRRTVVGACRGHLPNGSMSRLFESFTIDK